MNLRSIIYYILGLLSFMCFIYSVKAQWYFLAGLNFYVAIDMFICSQKER